METMIKDPIHGFIRFDNQWDALILDLLNSPDFQRLRRIRQLSTASCIFPTADHSRFSHSVGTFWIVKKMLTHLLGCHSIAKDEYDQVYHAMTAAALLHDIGHGPFSHVFEIITNVSHEIFTQRVIAEASSVNSILRSYDPHFPLRINDIFSHSFNRPYCNELISGILDADRLDFIARDTYMSGIQYGMIDIERIINVIRVVDNQLVVLEKGVGVIEEFLLARYYMYRELYYHKVGRGMAIVLKTCLKRAQELIQAGDHSFLHFPLARFISNPEAPHLPLFLQIDDTDVYGLLKYLMTHDDLIVSDLAKRFVQRILLKSLFDVTDAQLVWIKNRMVEMGYNPNYYLAVDSGELSVHHSVQEGNLIGQDDISILKRNGTISSLSKQSRILHLVHAKYITRIVFLPSDVRTAFRNEYAHPMS